MQNSQHCFNCLLLDTKTLHTLQGEEATHTNGPSTILFDSFILYYFELV